MRPYVFISSVCNLTLDYSNLHQWPEHHEHLPKATQDFLVWLCCCLDSPIYVPLDVIKIIVSLLWLLVGKPEREMNEGDKEKRRKGKKRGVEV